MAKRSNSISQEQASKKARTASNTSDDEGKFADAKESATTEANEEAVADEQEGQENKDANIDSALIAHSEEKGSEAASSEIFIEEPYAAAAAEQSKQPAAAAAAADSAAVSKDEPTADVVPEDILAATDKTDKAKPEKDSEEYHRIRKESHKEVERRRRENINAGIRELSALLPTTETHKYLILTKAAEYIKRLKENESNNTEKWTLEKLLKEQTNNELSASNEKLKNELERAYRELEHWKRIAEPK
ncbi:hypothetical protein WICPIJ_004489 [Wickerhamomyces pijperi]|uniref:BHLH domain-containing protein n=1 Tax=Wickerhamomyces pijperi TaxID=599730 RepID=A0A9P8Q803_WICPI|nr:hypothetical protein WICPIJ_004489 [Wickerhamomyces pijperi]